MLKRFTTDPHLLWQGFDLNLAVSKKCVVNIKYKTFVWMLIAFSSGKLFSCPHQRVNDLGFERKNTKHYIIVQHFLSEFCGNKNVTLILFS